MLNESTNNLNYEPENSHIARYESIVVDAIRSQAFLFEKINMGKFRRKIPLCACGCEERVKKSKIKPYNWNKFIYGHQTRGDNNPMKGIEVKKYHAFIMKEKQIGKKISKAHLLKGQNHASKRPEVRKKISESKIGKKRPDIAGNNHWMKDPKIVAKITGKNNGFYGKTHTKEIRKFLSKLKTGRKNPKQSKYMLNGGSAHSLSFRKNPSKPQIKLFKLIKSIYSNAKIEYSSLKYRIDIAIPNKNIAIEYDGSYWHQDKEADIKRQKELENIGWKFLRYCDYIPTLDKLKTDLNRII